MREGHERDLHGAAARLWDEQDESMVWDHDYDVGIEPLADRPPTDEEDSESEGEGAAAAPEALRRSTRDRQTTRHPDFVYETKQR